MTFDKILPFFISGEIIQYIDSNGCCMRYFLENDCYGNEWISVLENNSTEPCYATFDSEELKADNWEVVPRKIPSNSDILNAEFTAKEYKALFKEGF